MREKKTKKQLMVELEELRQRVVELEKSETKLKEANATLRKAQEECDLRVNERTSELKETKKVQLREQAEEAMRSSEYRLAMAVEASGAGVYEYKVPFGPDNYYSKGWAKMLGYKQEELPRSHDFIQWLKDIVHPDDHPRLKKAYSDFIHGRTAKYDVEIRMRHKTGEWITVQSLAKAIERDEKGNVTHIVGVMLDITERKLAEETLKESEEIYKTLTENSLTGIFLVRPNGAVIFVNKRMAEMHGYRTEEMYGISLMDTIYPDDWEKIRKVAEKFLGGGIPVTGLEIRRLRKDGTVFLCDMIITHFQYRGDVAILGNIIDITDRRQAKEALRDSEELYKSLTENSLTGIFLTRYKEKPLFVNQRMAEVHGYTTEEMYGMKLIETIHPDDIEKIREINDTHLREKIPVTNAEVRRVKKDGTIFWCNMIVSYLQYKGESAILGNIIDITDRKLAGEQIKASLKEKEVLLSEIHHRVKNNLAVISSLLSMQANEIKDTRVREALQENQNRVMAMALVHETLYQSENLTAVDFRRYVEELVGNLISVFEGYSGRIQLEVDEGNVNLQVNQAVPCGLIINELATNAMKHAFLSRPDGILRIKTDYYKEKEIVLKVSDNGIGFPADMDWKNSRSLGLRLISLMVEQLHGTWGIKNNQGTEITIRWPIHYNENEIRI